MRPATLILLPDRLTDPFPIVRIDRDGARRVRRASLSTIRSGEDGIARGGVRRYETTDPPDQHAGDMTNRRVVLDDDTDPAPRPRLPGWARDAATLHPDRQDIAAWLACARKTPTAPWVAHLPLAVRDAMRTDAPCPDAVIAMSDRAFLAASDDGAVNALGSIEPGFTGPAHEIDDANRRTGTRLAPLPLSRHPVITRAEAVLAEALVDAHDARPLPTPATVRHRWAQAVTEGHAGRLRDDGVGRFSAPLAILDDHRSGNLRATLILATLRLHLDPAAPGIGLDYHWACRVHASGPIQLDLVTPLLPTTGTPDPHRQALIDAIEDQDLPVLELASRPDGAFDARALMDRIGDATPLLARHPAFTFVEAALAVLHWRQPDAHQPDSGHSWTALLPHRSRPRPPGPPAGDHRPRIDAAHEDRAPSNTDPGAEGAPPATKPTSPPRTPVAAETSPAPETAPAGEHDQNAREPDPRGSEEGGAAGEDTTDQFGEHEAPDADAALTDDGQGDIPDVTLADDPGEDDDTEAGGSTDGQTGRPLGPPGVVGPGGSDATGAVVAAISAATEPSEVEGAAATRPSPPDDPAATVGVGQPPSTTEPAETPAGQGPGDEAPDEPGHTRRGDAMGSGTGSNGLVAHPPASPSPPNVDGADRAPEPAPVGEHDQNAREPDPHGSEEGGARAPGMDAGAGEAERAAVATVLAPVFASLTDTDRAVVAKVRALAIKMKRVPEGLSEILCGGRFHSAGPKPFAEGDGELGPGFDPLPRRSPPVGGRTVEDKV